MNSSTSIILPGQAGRVAAILTSVEFIVGTIAALFLGPFLYGIWLLQLHVKGKVTLKKSELKYRLLRREVIGLLMASCFTAFVALVENSLQEDIRVTDREVEDPHCARTDVLYDYFTMYRLKPPFHYSIDDWSLNIASQIGCKDTGLLTIQFGGSNGTALTNGAFSLNAPKCRDTPVETNPFFPKLDDGIAFTRDIFVRFYDFGLKPNDAIVSIFPYWDSEEVGQSREEEEDHSIRDPYEPIANCLKYNISSMPIRYYVNWDIAGIDDYNVSRIVLKRICDNIENQLPERISEKEADRCDEDGFNPLSTLCVLENATVKQKASVNLTDVGLYLTEDFETSKADKRIVYDKQITYATRAVACPRVDVNIKYFLVSTNMARRNLDEPYYYGLLPKDQLILVPYKVEVISGKCEPTIPDLGLSALIHTANANWTKNSLASMDKHILYHAYMLSMAKSFFRHSAFRRQTTTNESLNITSYPCLLRQVEQITVIERDWKFVVLVLVAVVSLLFVLVANCFLIGFPRSAWRISPTETLQRYNPLHRSLERGEEYIIGSDTSSRSTKGPKDASNSPVVEEKIDPEISIQLVRSSRGEGRGTRYRIVPSHTL